MGTRAQIDLRYTDAAGAHTQRYFRHFDGYPTEIIPQMRWVCSQMGFRPDHDAWRDLEARFFVSMNLYNRLQSALVHGAWDREACFERIAEEEDAWQKVVLQHSADRDRYERIAEGEETDHAYAYTVTLLTKKALGWQEQGVAAFLEVEGYETCEEAIADYRAMGSVCGRRDELKFAQKAVAERAAEQLELVA